MEDITRLPNIRKMVLTIITEGHSFGASVFHILRMCSGVRILVLERHDATSCPEVILSVFRFPDTWYAFTFHRIPRLYLLVALLSRSWLDTGWLAPNYICNKYGLYICQ